MGSYARPVPATDDQDSAGQQSDSAGQQSESAEVLRARIAELEAELAVARESATEAERARGDAVGALTQARNEFAAAHLNQQEWDRLLAEHIEAERLCAERCAQLEADHRRVVESTTWRIVQTALAPYRWVRARRG